MIEERAWAIKEKATKAKAEGTELALKALKAFHASEELVDKKANFEVESYVFGL